MHRACGISYSEIEVKREFYVEGESAKYLLRAEGHPDVRLRRRLDEYKVDELKQLAVEFSIEIGGAKVKLEIIRSIQTWLATQPKVPAEIELPSDLINRIPIIEIFSAETALDPEREIYKVLSYQFRSLIENDRYSGRISSIATEIETDLNEELDKLHPFVKSYCKDVEQITIRPTFNFASGLNMTQLQLHRKGQNPVLLRGSGAGQRRRFTLAIYEWQLQLLKNRDTDSRQLIIAFDEPDTHLDYLSQRQIFRLILRFVNLANVQVVVCTHSLNMIEQVPINQVVHYSLDENRYAMCQTLSPNDYDKHEIVDLFMYQIGENMGLRNSVMLYERCFLIVEGSTEMHALPPIFHFIFGVPMQSVGVRLFNGENNYGARMFTKFLHENKRVVLFLVDSDSKTDPGSKKLFTSKSFLEDGINEHEQVHFVGNKEFEDGFSDEVWVRMAEKYYLKLSGDTWTKAEFALLRTKQKFSHALQALIKKETGRSVSKPELGYNLGRTIQRLDEIPEELIHCLRQACDLANNE